MIDDYRVKPGHPLAKEIRAYQRERKRRLAQAGAPPRWIACARLTAPEDADLVRTKIV